jgi:hypothetical protein
MSANAMGILETQEALFLRILEIPAPVPLIAIKDRRPRRAVIHRVVKIP